jgi:hypothetical protein
VDADSYDGGPRLFGTDGFALPWWSFANGTAKTSLLPIRVISEFEAKGRQD